MLNKLLDRLSCNLNAMPILEENWNKIDMHALSRNAQSKCTPISNIKVNDDILFQAKKFEWQL